MPGLIPLLIFVITLTFFSGAYFISSTFYQKKFNVNYSLKRMFPYEVNYPTTFKNNVYGNVAFIISLAGTVAFYIYYLVTREVITVPVYATMALSAFMAIFVGFLFFMPLKYLRFHMIVSTLAMVSAFSIPALNAIVVYTSMHMDPNNQGVYITAMIIGGLMSLAMLILLLNPNATYKIYMEKEKDAEGNEKVVRPKFIPMAFNEWWAIITFVVSPISLLIISFLG